MNLKHKLNSDVVWILFCSVIIIAMIITFNPSKKQENIKPIDQKPRYFRELKYEELSPDGLNKIILYYLYFDSSFYRDYYDDYFNNDTVISVRDIESRRENYIFTGNRINKPKWLGNEYVFFTSYCGTSCQGIYLVNVLNKETWQGVLSYMVLDESRGYYTVFSDWFGKEFKFDGLVDEIRSETIGNKTYLIFYMQNNDGKSVGQKRFLFLGEKLLEV